MNQGDVYWYTFRTPDKRRPVVILTRNSALHYLTGVTIAPITSTVRGIATEVRLSQADGMPADCAANMDNIQTVQKERLGSLVTRLSSVRMSEIRDALEFALGLDDLN